VGIRGLHKKKAIRKIMDPAEKTSRWLWIKMDDTWSQQATYCRQKSRTDRWVAWARVYDVVRPETPNEPRIHH